MIALRRLERRARGGSVAERKQEIKPMRYLYVLPGLAMIAFAAVQYNDPDVLVWATIYLIPAIWSMLAAFRPNAIRSAPGRALLWASTLAGLVGVVYYWPTMPGFWHKDVWRVEETAREGMGMMIAFAVLVTVLFSAHRKPAQLRSG